MSLLADDLLYEVERPGRYIGGEVNSVIKPDAPQLIHFCLAFPDTYEVGMSHLGIQILYQLLNDREDCFAERVFMPYPDMERALCNHKVLLSSLESGRILSDFDVVGFSLQYEMCGTNILAMLELGGITLRAAERGSDEPLIIAGGPFASHAAVLSPFIDAFFIGDGEDGVLKIADEIREAKKNQGTAWRSHALKALSKLIGVYVPVCKTEANKSGPVQKSVVADLNKVPMLSRPLVPIVPAIHDRLGLEVMRGCVRGCRFCQAGFIYRPQRERAPELIVKQLNEGLKATGFDEVSLLSLSTADYCSLVPLLRNIHSLYDPSELTVSFPSTRVDALTLELLEEVPTQHRHRFTLAPEGGSQRLRDVINKGLSDEQIIETVQNVFRLGWQGLKLYFMIGLPTETDSDLEGIVELARKLEKLPESRGREITVNVSTFVPKPHTPFQWAEQISPEETLRRQNYLYAKLRPTKVKLRTHPPFVSMLEGVFARGGSELAQVIERAYRLGCRLDAWPDYFRRELWEQAFVDCQIDPLRYLRSRSLEESLPWGHIEMMVSQDFLKREYERAISVRTTHSCLFGRCPQCGVCEDEVLENVFFKTSAGGKGDGSSQVDREASKIERVTHNQKGLEPVQRMRLVYAKEGRARFLGHVECGSSLLRALRRGDERGRLVPIAYTSGFSPKPRVSFGPPLSLGVASKGEYCDLFLSQKVDPEMIWATLSQGLPHGMEIRDVGEVDLRTPSLQESISGFQYELTWGCDQEIEGVIRKLLVDNVYSQSGCLIDLQEIIFSLPQGSARPGSHTEKALLSCGSQWRISRNKANGRDLWCLDFIWKVLPGVKSIRSFELVQALTGLPRSKYSLLKKETFFADRSPCAERPIMKEDAA